MARLPKIHDNREVRDVLINYRDLADFTADHPKADDILSGLSVADGTGDRGLCRTLMFKVLRGCDHITTEEVRRVTLGRLRERMCRIYAAACRLASVFLAGLFKREGVGSAQHRPSEARTARQELRQLRERDSLEIRETPDEIEGFTDRDPLPLYFQNHSERVQPKAPMSCQG